MTHATLCFGWLRPAWFLTILAACFGPPPAAAAEEPAAFKMHACTGEFAGKDVEPIAQAEARPLVLIFVAADKFDRPISRYLRKLDEQVAAGVEGAKDASITAVWLTEDSAKSKEYLPKVQQSLNLSRTALGVFDGQKAGPAGWNVDIASHLTVIILKEGKELKRFAYGSTNDQDVPEAIAALKKSGG